MIRRVPAPRPVLALAMPLLACALLASTLLPWALSASRAEAEDDPAAAPGVAWVPEWPAARARAARTGQLVFVYVGRKRPPCPPCRQLEEAVFSQRAARVLGERYVAARILTGDDANAATQAFTRRYAVGSVPTLLALASDGAVLARAFPRDLEGILAIMTAAEAAEAVFRKQAAALATSTRPDDIRTLARLHAGRWQWAEARRGYEALLAAEPRVEDQEALLRVLAALRDDAARVTLLTAMIDTHAAHPHHVHWLVERAAAGASDKPALRDALRDLLATLARPAAQATVRAALAAVLHDLRDTEGATAQWDWILTHAAARPEAIDALLAKAKATLGTGYGRGDLATVRAGRALLQRLIDEHGEHPHAAEAKRLRIRADRVIAQLEAKARAAQDAEPGSDR